MRVDRRSYQEEHNVGRWRWYSSADGVWGQMLKRQGFPSDPRGLSVTLVVGERECALLGLVGLKR